MAQMKAYFYTQSDAQRAGDRLGMRFEVGKPEPVDPVLGRPWRIIVAMPEEPMSQFPNPAFSDEVVGMALLFNGVVHTQDQP